MISIVICYCHSLLLPQKHSSSIQLFLALSGTTNRNKSLKIYLHYIDNTWSSLPPSGDDSCMCWKKWFDKWLVSALMCSTLFPPLWPSLHVMWTMWFYTQPPKLSRLLISIFIQELDKAPKFITYVMFRFLSSESFRYCRRISQLIVTLRVGVNLIFWFRYYH